MPPIIIGKCQHAIRHATEGYLRLNRVAYFER
nr:MAG TPA: hypothetical protein [Caudoviricetes sp.]